MPVRDKAGQGLWPTPAKAHELPDGVPAEPEAPLPKPPRDSKGRLIASPETTALAAAGGRKGGVAAKASRDLRALLGAWEPDEFDEWHHYHQLRLKWYEGHLATLAQSVGGGEVGPGPASVVASAAMQFAASRWLADKGAREKDKDALLSASRLADSSRQNLLAAHELCAKEAAGRKKAQQAGQPWNGEQGEADPEVSLTGKRGRPRKKRK